MKKLFCKMFDLLNPFKEKRLIFQGPEASKGPEAEAEKPDMPENPATMEEIDAMLEDVKEEGSKIADKGEMEFEPEVITHSKEEVSSAEKAAEGLVTVGSFDIDRAIEATANSIALTIGGSEGQRIAEGINSRLHDLVLAPEQQKAFMDEIRQAVVGWKEELRGKTADERRMHANNLPGYLNPVFDKYKNIRI